MLVETPDPKHGIAIQDFITRNAVVDWIEQERCDHAVTLALNKPMPIEHARRRVGDWLYELEHHIRGCRPYRLPLSTRLMAFIFPEHASSNIHFHLAIRLIDGQDVTPHNLDDVLGVSERIWMSLTPSGTIAIKRIYDQRGWAYYLTKECYEPDAGLFLSHDFIH